MLKPEDIYDMALHQEKSRKGMRIIRVPGGWLYVLWDWNQEHWGNAVFVPYSDQFNPTYKTAGD